MDERQSTSPSDVAYSLDNAWQNARERLALLESLADPSTIRHLERLGVAAGWRCWEAGGGGGSITAWFCQRAGPTGRVVATDLDTRFVDALDYPNLEVRRHDIVVEAPPGDAFDLIHARALLVHLPAREMVIDRMVAALRPGGWLLLEEPDYISKIPDPGNDPRANDVFARVRSAEVRWMAEGGIDERFGRHLYASLLRRGLEEVDAEGRVPMARGGTPLARFYRLTTEQARKCCLDTGLA